MRQTAVTPEHEIRLSGGAKAVFTVAFEVDCDRFRRAANTDGGVADPGLDLRLAAEGPLGGERLAFSSGSSWPVGCGVPGEED